MDQAKQFTEELSGVTSYRTIYDVISDYMTYVLFFIGLFVSAIYLPQGGDIMCCNPVIKCNSTSIRSKMTPKLRSECEKYSSVSSSHSNDSFLVVHFNNLNQYKLTNSYCSEDLLGLARFPGPLISAAAILLFLSGRLWYGLPMIKTHLKNFEFIVKEAEKLPHKDMVNDLFGTCKELNIGKQDTKPEGMWNRLRNCLVRSRGQTGTNGRVNTQAKNSTSLPPNPNVPSNSDTQNDGVVAFNVEENSSPTEKLVKARNTFKMETYGATAKTGPNVLSKGKRPAKMASSKGSDKDRKSYFQKRELLADVASKFGVEDIPQLFSFQNTVETWKKNTKGKTHWWYCFLTLLRLIFGLFLCWGSFSMVLLWKQMKQKEKTCKPDFRYNIYYNEILCTFIGGTFLFAICIIVLVLVGINSICCLITLLRTSGKLIGTVSDFYWLLFEMSNRFQAVQINVFKGNINDLEKRQIKTDVESPFTKLGTKTGDFSSRPMYTVEEAVHGIPSCLFTSKIDDQDWCLQLSNSLTIEDSDFEPFKHLTGLKDMELVNCKSISCNLCLKKVEKLKIKESYLQDELTIGHKRRTGHPEQKKLWQIPKLTYLTLSDIRPLKSLTLEVWDITELSLSEMGVQDPKDYVENFEKLSVLHFHKCKIDVVNIRVESSTLTELSLIGCEIKEIPVLICENLKTLNLTENKIKIGDKATTETKLPKLENLILTNNPIKSLNFAYFHSLELGDSLKSFCVDEDVFSERLILSYISLVFCFATNELAEHILYEGKYGGYQICNEKIFFPSFERASNAKGHAVFYCNFSDDKVRGRLSLYMACSAQLLYRKHCNIYTAHQFSEYIKTCKKENTFPDIYLNSPTYIYLALNVEDDDICVTNTLAIIRELIMAKLKVYVVVDFEIGTTQEMVIKLFRGQDKQIDLSKYIHCYILNKFPLVTQKIQASTTTLVLKDNTSVDAKDIMPFLKM